MYKNILVPMDGSKLAECVLPHVETIIKGCSIPNVIFARVVEPAHTPSGTGTDGAMVYTEKDAEAARKAIAEQEKKEAEMYLDSLVARLNYGNATLQKEVLAGKVADILAEYAKNENVDLIIMSTHGRSGISRWVLGSTADRIMRSSCVPVMMVRAPGCVPGI